MKCKYCNSIEELSWPENYKKGDRPVNAETGLPHTCLKEEDKVTLNGKPAHYYCYECNNQNEYCEDLNCIYCKTLPRYCPHCHKHPQVSNVK